MKRLMGIFGVFLLVLPWAMAQERGVGPDTIRLGMIAAMTGPVATIGVPLFRGMDAYFRWLNAQGGIHGRRVELLIEDDQYLPANTVAVARKLVERDQVFALVRTLGTPTTAAIMDYVTQQRVPLVGIASGASLWLRPFREYIFGIQPTYTTEGKLMARYAVEELGARRIAVFYQNDAFGKEGMEAFTRVLRERYRLEPVALVPYEAADRDFSAHALALRRANPDLVFVYAIVVPASSLLREAQRIGLRPKWLMTYVLADPVLLQLAGPAAEGIYAGAWLVDPATAPEAETYRQALRRYYPGEEPGGYSLSSWATGEVVAEALRRAGRNLQRRGFLLALETLKGFTTGLTPALEYSPTDHEGIKQIAIVRAERGRWVTVKPFFGEGR
ncbi:ABC transporter substrate-binding protein [Thermus sp. FJN-A]